jgi:tripartite-type tricarboxylate transporter receptor subunit TctC
LVTAIEKAVKNPELKAKVDKVGYLVDYKSPAELNRLEKEEYEIANVLAIKMGLWK